MTKREMLWRAGQVLADKGLVESNLGTISCRESEGTFLTKPGPLHYLFASPKDFVRVDSQGKVLEPGKFPPSENWKVHARCYEARPDIGAVVHAHPIHVIVLISTMFDRKFDKYCVSLFPTPKTSFLPLTGEFTWFFKPVHGQELRIPVVPNLNPKPLAEAVGREIVKSNIVLIENHGIIAVGQDILEALSAALATESEAEKIYKSYLLGSPQFLDSVRIRHEVDSMPHWFSPPFDRNSHS